MSVGRLKAAVYCVNRWRNGSEVYSFIQEKETKVKGIKVCHMPRNVL